MFRKDIVIAPILIVGCEIFHSASFRVCTPRALHSIADYLSLGSLQELEIIFQAEIIRLCGILREGTDLPDQVVPVIRILGLHILSPGSLPCFIVRGRPFFRAGDLRSGIYVNRDLFRRCAIRGFALADLDTSVKWIGTGFWIFHPHCAIIRICKGLLRSKISHLNITGLS